MLELPCDWTVNRRPTASSHATATSTATATASGKRPAAPPTSSSSQHGDEARSTPLNEEEAAPPHHHYDEHPLGPRSVVLTPSGAGDVAKEGGQVKALVLARLQSTSAESEETEAEARLLIDTESLISRLPYKRMLNDMFGGNLHGPLQNPTIPYVTRTYEESFMRERMSSNERECARGAQCECMFIDRAQPFVGVEFLLPGESTTARTPHLCVLCCRATTQQLYYDVMFDKFEFQGTIQRFGNIHSQPGEYALDAMLIAVPSAPTHIMPLPIVSHQRNRYSVYVSGGIKRLRQTRVLFQSTPLRSADDGQ